MAGTQRFPFVDGLRGVAALAVLAHHATCRTICAPVLQAGLPGIAWGVLFNLNAGVDIFFVVSGFVIAHSLRSSTFAPGEVGRFIARRQLRLDPPYWVVVLLALLIGWVASRTGVAVKVANPATAWSVAANLFYLQGLFGIPPAVDVSWTLCIEVQFYLAFVLLMAVGRLRGPTTCGRPSRSARALLFATAAVSMCAADPAKPGATLVPYWCYFAGGVLCYWVYRHHVSAWMLPALLVVGVGGSVAVRQLGARGPLNGWLPGFSDAAVPWHVSIPACVGIVTVGCLHWVGRTGGLTSGLSNRPIQYFGAISYSLYLVHVTVLGTVTRGGARLLHLGDVGTLLLVPVGVGLSVAVAHALHVVVERPSVRLANRVGRREPTGEPAREGVADPAVVAA